MLHSWTNKHSVHFICLTIKVKLINVYTTNSVFGSCKYPYVDQVYQHEWLQQVANIYPCSLSIISHSVWVFPGVPFLLIRAFFPNRDMQMKYDYKSCYKEFSDIAKYIVSIGKAYYIFIHIYPSHSMNI